MRIAYISEKEIANIQAMLDLADKCHAPECQDGALFVHREDEHGFISSRGIRLLISEVRALRGQVGGLVATRKKTPDPTSSEHDAADLNSVKREGE